MNYISGGTNCYCCRTLSGSEREMMDPEHGHYSWSYGESMRRMARMQHPKTCWDAMLGIAWEGDLDKNECNIKCCQQVTAYLWIWGNEGLLHC